jgi:hypothetical protein
MRARLESTRRLKMEPITRSWKLTIADRRLIWLQKQHPSAAGQKLQLWALHPER